MRTRSIFINIAMFTLLSSAINLASAGSLSEVDQMDEKQIKALMTTFFEKRFNRWVEIEDLREITYWGKPTKRVYIAISNRKEDWDNYSLIVHVRKDYQTPEIDTEYVAEVKSYEVNCDKAKAKGLAYTTYDKHGKIIKRISLGKVTDFEPVKKFYRSPEGQACSGKPFEKLLIEGGLLNAEEQTLLNEYMRKAKIARVEKIEDRALDIPQVNLGY